jgi:hypothetical protein
MLLEYLYLERLKMAETANFSYDGNVVLKLRGGNEAIQANVKPSIEVKGVQHLIPVNVSIVIDGEPAVVTAYVDYSTMEINLPTTTARLVVDAEEFKKTLRAWFADRDEREAVEYEANSLAEVEARRQAAKQVAAAAAMRSAGSRIVTEDDGEED